MLVDINTVFDRTTLVIKTKVDKTIDDEQTIVYLTLKGYPKEATTLRVADTEIMHRLSVDQLRYLVGKATEVLNEINETEQTQELPQ